jgi:hypothetical protein
MPPNYGVFYHDPNDDWGCQVEQQARQEILEIAAALRSGSHLHNGLDNLLPIPHITDLVGALQGNRNLSPAYRMRLSRVLSRGLVAP